MYSLKKLRSGHFVPFKRIFNVKLLFGILILGLILDFISSLNLVSWFGKDNPVNKVSGFIASYYVTSGVAYYLFIWLRKNSFFKFFFLLLLVVILFYPYGLIPKNLWFEPIRSILAIIIMGIAVSWIVLIVSWLVRLRGNHLFKFIIGLRRFLLSGTFRNLILFGLVLVLAGAFWQINNLNQRLSTVENRFGGKEKVSCTEKDTISKVRESVVRIVGGESEGSGFAIKAGGTIVTNFHVIEFEPSPKVLLPDNTFETAEIVMADKNADLAILKINKDLPVITWGRSEFLEQTDELLAIGYPFGGTLVGESSVNKGILAGTRYSKDAGIIYLQTDATLNPGVSGGPMVDICGNVMGINTAGTAGLGLAISSKSFKDKQFDMLVSKDPLKDVKKITLEPNKSPLDAVNAFYSYLKMRKMQEAFGMLSDNFKKGYDFDYWVTGYKSLLDNTAIKIGEDKNIKNRINIKLSTKELINEDIIYKYFEGYWDVKQIDGKWLLWDPEIKEVKEPGYMWFYE